jgi:hypothetical protein
MNGNAERQVVCIGDLHGQLAKVKDLWARLASFLGKDCLAQITVVFLGDYCDRGPDTKGVFDWLIELEASRAPGKTIFITGNHDIAMGAFLGCMPASIPENFDLQTTVNPKFTSGFWPFDVEGGRGMHYLGRRWGGSAIYNAHTTFASYGVQWDASAEGSREALLKAVPQAHKDFLSRMLWVYEQPLQSVARAEGDSTGDESLRQLIAVHAGLSTPEGADDSVEAQLRALRSRDITARSIQKKDLGYFEPFSGRRNVLDSPAGLPDYTLLVSSNWLYSLHAQSLNVSVRI